MTRGTPIVIRADGTPVTRQIRDATDRLRGTPVFEATAGQPVKFVASDSAVAGGTAPVTFVRKVHFVTGLGGGSIAGFGDADPTGLTAVSDDALDADRVE